MWSYFKNLAFICSKLTTTFTITSHKWWEQQQFLRKISRNLQKFEKQFS